MGKIIVNRSGAQHFSPNPYPESGVVYKHDKIKFSSADDKLVAFYAEAGLFYLEGDRGDKNTGHTKFKAPAKGDAPLTLYVAHNPKNNPAGFVVSLSPINATSMTARTTTTTGCDGMINVGAHRKEPPPLEAATPVASSD